MERSDVGAQNVDWGLHDWIRRIRPSIDDTVVGPVVAAGYRQGFMDGLEAAAQLVILKSETEQQGFRRLKESWGQGHEARGEGS